MEICYKADIFNLHVEPTRTWCILYRAVSDKYAISVATILLCLCHRKLNLLRTSMYFCVAYVSYPIATASSPTSTKFYKFTNAKLAIKSRLHHVPVTHSIILLALASLLRCRLEEDIQL